MTKIQAIKAKLNEVVPALYAGDMLQVALVVATYAAAILSIVFAVSMVLIGAALVGAILLTAPPSSLIVGTAIRLFLALGISTLSSLGTLKAVGHLIVWLQRIENPPTVE